MKHLFAFLILIVAYATSFAQRSFVAERNRSNSTASKVDSLGCFDTLGLCAYKASTKILYKDQFGGYAVGTNFFGDVAKAQQFNDSISYSIQKILLCFGYKKKVAASANSYLAINIYSLDDSTGISTGGVNVPRPGTILDSRNLLLDSIDTIAGHFTVVNFDWVQTRYNNLTNFAVGIDMTHLDTADQVGLYSTKDSSANKSEHAWEKQSSGTWYTMLKSWPLDIDLAIFPVVDTLYVGIPENGLTHSLSLNISPNPANQLTTLNFELDEPGFVSLQISNSDGKLMLQQNKTAQFKGKQKLELNTSIFKSGVYNCSIQTSKAIQSKRLVIIH